MTNQTNCSSQAKTDLATSQRDQGNVQATVDTRFVVKELDAGNDQWSVYDKQTNKYWSHEGWQQPDAGLASVLDHSEALAMVSELNIQGQGNVHELAKFVADYESGIIASRGAINDKSFDKKRIVASKAAIASGSEHEVAECLNWWKDAISTGALAPGKVANCVEHAAAGLSGVFTAKYDQYAERDGQAFTVLGAVDPKTYDSEEGGEMFFIRFADDVVIEAWPEEVESALKAQENVLLLQSHGFFVGERDATVKPEFPGRFMVRDTEDNEDGFAIVGDDLGELISEAIEHLRFLEIAPSQDEAEASIQDVVDAVQDRSE
jgi:hypothetical protein